MRATDSLSSECAAPVSTKASIEIRPNFTVI